MFKVNPMIHFKHQTIIYTCAAIPFFIIWIIGGPEALLLALNRAGSFAVLLGRGFIVCFYTVITAFCVYEAIRLYLKLKRGNCIKEESRILITWTTFILIMIYRYYSVLF